eukprot:gene20805-27639_t
MCLQLSLGLWVLGPLGYLGLVPPWVIGSWAPLGLWVLDPLGSLGLGPPWVFGSWAP